MDSITHPVLCCVGDSVAGQPTQFLMEKALAAAHLDWRVISVEVPGGSLDAAFAGMQAMGFAALRIFPPLTHRAAELLCPESHENTFVGAITSAKSDAQGWRCWHHSGAAIQACASRSCTWTSSTLWLHGDSQQLRSLVLHCRENPPQSIVWTAGPTSVPTETAERVRLQLFAQESELDLIALLTQQLSTEVENGTLVVLGELTESRLQSLASLEVPPHCRLITVVPGSGVKRRLKTNWRGDQLVVVSEVELAVAQEAIDFQRWTDREADLTLLQDAYEEYTDF